MTELEQLPVIIALIALVVIAVRTYGKSNQQDTVLNSLRTNQSNHAVFLRKMALIVKSNTDHAKSKHYDQRKSREQERWDFDDKEDNKPHNKAAKTTDSDSDEKKEKSYIREVENKEKKEDKKHKAEKNDEKDDD